MRLTPAQIDDLRRRPLNGAANKVRAALEFAGATQKDVAEALNTVQPEVSDIVRGKYVKLPLERARSYARLFGCAIEDLFPAREEVCDVEHR